MSVHIHTSGRLSVAWA